MFEFLAVGVGGFIGSCVRFALTRVLGSVAPSFPYGTLISNIIAAFLIGFVIGLEQQTMKIPIKTNLFLTTGLLGGLSTFSTFSVETVVFFQRGKFLLASGNVLLNLILCLLFVPLGMAASKLIFGNT